MKAETRVWLSLADIEKDSSSYVDPQGYVFHYEGTIYRAIRRGAAPFYRSLFDDRVIDALVADYFLVPSTIADLEVDDPDVGFVIQHKKIEPLSYCIEWCPAMLCDAARATVDLLLALLDRNATLQDAYPWNIVFRGAEPVFVDLTSIVEIRTPLLWPAYDQFQAFFQRPLVLSAQGKGVVARTLMLNNISGVSREDFFRITTFSYKLTHPLVGLGYRLDRLIQQKKTLKSRLKQVAEANVTVDNRVRARLFKGLRRKLDALSFAKRGDGWAVYYEEIGPAIDKEAKLRIVGKLLDQLAPTTVLDIGSNTGVFSVLAAQQGTRVVAIDSSEACINSLYAQAKTNSLNILPLVADILCPTPAFGFMGAQYPSLVERVRSDVVLCLALMHHLHISGRQSFDRIARLMDKLTNRHLIFEFVAKDDPNNDLLGAGRPIDYELEGVVAELRPYFPKIDVFESDRPTRKILLCSKDKI